MAAFTAFSVFSPQTGRGCLEIAAELGHDDLLVYLVSGRFGTVCPHQFDSASIECNQQDEQFKIIDDVHGDIDAAKADLEEAMEELRKAEELRDEALEVLRTVRVCLLPEHTRFRQYLFAALVLVG